MTLCVYVCECVTETKRPSDGLIRGGGLELLMVMVEHFLKGGHAGVGCRGLLLICFSLLYPV